MIGWSGRRKTLTILAFIAPDCCLGVLIFNVYPISSTFSSPSPTATNSTPILIARRC